MNFGEALERLKGGDKIFREGWDLDKIMYIYLLNVAQQPVIPIIFSKTNYSNKVPWMANHQDILGEDWEVVQ